MPIARSPGLFLQFSLQSKIKKVLGESQYGMGIPAAAETMIKISDTLAKLVPNDAFLALDISNAFGEINRSEIIDEALKVLPQIVPFLLSIWGDSYTSIFIAGWLISGS